ncbi:FecR domain-containing protein [Pusillimonas sp. ANT_WB101]|uniref:FecR family protein n=1 Tax=Pusillimonas sp. ANT_WB101 TaxID=2597356 RepID=UPI0011F02A5F|nr:FecR domain-containing protein [Pusillimonas sp. ANT_WB101]KAA0910713.1 hypothetical protein FQ179_02220 [Pusillimonas sp. ANT_WB101]
MNYFKFGRGLLFAGLMVFGTNVSVAETVASVRFASGLVTATAVSQPARTLAKDDGIENGSRIETAANGRVQMRFTDGGLVSLMPDSTFSVDDYAYQEGADDGSLVFGLLRGGLRTMTGAIGKTRHEGYQLNTPVATLGIRGTQFTVVLNPPDTLRVHVGEGKVVITNASGTLEVPAGRNAVVTLGSAPEFTEQGPMYRATAPMGDRLVATGVVRHDVLIGPPLTDQDILRSIDDFKPLPPESPSVNPAPVEPGPIAPTPIDPIPVDPTPIDPTPIDPTPIDPGPVGPPPSAFLSDGPGYTAAGALYSTSTGPGTWQQGMSGSGLTAEFDPATGGLLSLGDFPSLPVVSPGEFETSHVVTRGALSWGDFSYGSGTIAGNSVSMVDGGQYMPYVVGLAADNIPTTGTLYYSLDGATSVRGMQGEPLAEALLEQFDLGLNLSNQTYTLDMRLNTSDFGIYNAVSNGGSWTGSPNGFRFDDSVVSNADGCSYGCRLEVEGFVAGHNATQAGVGYLLIDNDHAFIGAAGLVGGEGL